MKAVCINSKVITELNASGHEHIHLGVGLKKNETYNVFQFDEKHYFVDELKDVYLKTRFRLLDYRFVYNVIKKATPKEEEV